MSLMKKCVNTEGGKVRWNFPCGNECVNVSHVLWECSAYM